jgi:hypothetical protein
MKLCPPAMVYLFIAILALILNLKFSIMSVIIHIFFIAAWTFILNWICSKGYVWISWVLVLLPYIFTGLIVLIAAEIIAINKLDSAGKITYYTVPPA